MITKDEAEILRILSEAEKFREEAGAWKADREIKLADARKRQADARSAEYHAENARISMEAALRQEGIALAGNHHHHTFEFVAGIYEEPVMACLAQMAVWHRQDSKCPMHIIIDSPGGSVIDGMHLFDQITAYSKRSWDNSNRPKGTHATTITVRGYAASMAGIILQAADTRIIGPEAFLMIHEVSSFAGGKIGEIKDEVQFLDKISERATDIFVRRSGGKITKQRFKRLWERKDVWLTSEEALDYGFVDKIG